ncbi:probable dolichyl pyrophosphate Man9GlcNAc2 alpha-1,3-glucosyltransferase isoform X3 [Glossina fuscipes]|nr:probable dolichyl pyrophosphate Man9GlcNAc2 alpha-1,3-glucosyltransferase isoform X3 [Glossina fuscipes]
MTERPKSKFLQFLLAKDEIITTKFVTFLLNYEPFRAIKAHTKALELSCDVCFSIAIRAAVSLHSYSGANKPPMYGDYEAQRHWQEITYNFSPKGWYKNSSNNNLEYWGLDYPPLTAYHSYVNAYIASKINSSFVDLKTSHGFESERHKTFMRSTVLAADTLIYLPACILVASFIDKVFKQNIFLQLCVLFVTYPGLILIDNGHFQYNNISLGLLLLAVYFILTDSNNLAALSFSLALNYKQMELYHAFPFFTYLLRSCLVENCFSRKLIKFLKIACVVTLTFLALWLPWLTSLDSLISTASRLFPLSRGVFEDKVANIWCSLNVIYKFKNKFVNTQMALICLVTTLSAALPTNLNLFACGKKETFLYTLQNTATAFFLFSFQVHEKSILLVALPSICLYGFMPFAVTCFLKVSILSILPLIIKDGLTIAYFSLVVAYNAILNAFLAEQESERHMSNNSLQRLNKVLDFLILIASLAAVWLPPPSHLPHLWAVIISVICCGFFLIFFIMGHINQFNYWPNIVKIILNKKV